MKFKKRIPSKKYYTPEEIHYNFDNVMLDDLLKHYISKALSKIPSKIVDKVITTCFFATTTRGEYIPSQYLKNQSLIIISSSYLRRARENNIIFTILHEVAHWFFKHDYIKAKLESSDPFNNKEHLEHTMRCERDADLQAKKWLQEYDNSPPVTKLEAGEWTKELWRVNGIEI